MLCMCFLAIVRQWYLLYLDWNLNYQLWMCLAETFRQKLPTHINVMLLTLSRVHMSLLALFNMGYVVLTYFTGLVSANKIKFN